MQINQSVDQSIRRIYKDDNWKKLSTTQGQVVIDTGASKKNVKETHD